MSFAHPPSVVSYLRRIGAEVLNPRRAMVKIHRGHYYVERAMIRFTEDGKVTCSVKEMEPTPEELAAMEKELKGIEFPKSIEATNLELLRGKTKGELYTFTNRKTNKIIMVQERRISKSGAKAYIPWVLLSTGEWASMEPDGDLPFWKPEKARGPGAKIMIHEGAKVAKFITELLASDTPHPWRSELEGYEHWGMIGGALAPHRTDYEELRAEAPTEVVYVCDNDHPGVSALQKVSRCWGKPLKGILFGKTFPAAWDMADKMPDALFTQSGRYIGPSLADLIEAATWATELVPQDKGRPVTVLRPEFAEEWVHCVTPEAFIHLEWPNRILSANEFNSRVAPFSHVDDTAKLLKRDFGSKSAVLRYVPGEASGIFASKGGRYINTYCASEIKPEKGDWEPWADYLRWLCPDKEDRIELKRWVATLIARPDIRMLYGVLMISETQGIGKGTLGEKVLAPLVGAANTSYPSEQEIVESQYNYWLAHKRLAVVHEIYAGHSSKAYNKLKSCITDRYATVQKKYQANYEIENWIHIFACSNSARALKLSMDDRRWFVPKLTEEKRGVEYWEKFNTWLQFQGGLQIIMWWAHEWVKKYRPVERGAAAPWSALKRQIVEEAYSPGQMIAARTLESIADKIKEGSLPKDSFILDIGIIEIIRDNLYDGRHNDRLERPATIRTLAKSMGWHIGEVRAKVPRWGANTNGGRVLSLDPEIAKKTPGELGGEDVLPERRKAPLDLRQLSAM